MDSEHQKGGFRGYFEWFVHSEVMGSILLLACTVAALGWANSQWAPIYEQLLHTSIGVSWGDAAFKLSLHHWINDGLMVIFFFVVGLEIKRELVVGQLSTFDKAVLPVVAAVGGMVVPAALYAILNAGGEGAPGWGVPMATDIAFALGVLAIFGKRVPIGLKVFLTALAIADDLGAVAVIAIFYTEKINFAALITGGVLLAILFVAVKVRFRRTGILWMLIIGVWLAIFASGVHATVAGILVAMVVPVRPRVGLGRFVAAAKDHVERIARMELTDDSIVADREQLHAVETIHTMAQDSLPSGLILERYLHPVQVWLILPLFALANAGVHFDSRILDTLANPISFGIILGLVVGKPLGITLFSWLAIRFGPGALPEGVSWGQIVGAGCVAGIGFTMSLFITELAFRDPLLVSESKVGILVASLAAGILGFILLSRSLPRGMNTE
ncbi:MAG: Na+/H+ antiporter NhaA [Thermoanaerobaculales bacterium]